MHSPKLAAVDRQTLGGGRVEREAVLVRVVGVGDGNGALVGGVCETDPHFGLGGGCGWRFILTLALAVLGRGLGCSFRTAHRVNTDRCGERSVGGKLSLRRAVICEGSAHFSLPFATDAAARAAHGGQ